MRVRIGDIWGGEEVGKIALAAEGNGVGRYEKRRMVI
jgi:hypothetical protein